MGSRRVADADDGDEAQIALDKAALALQACFAEGPLTGVLITIDADSSMLNIHTLNHAFPDLFGLLLYAMRIVHERELVGKATNSYNLH